MASADVPVERTMFVRKATGLVKGWSVFDAFIYSALSINLITLGFGYAFTGVAVLPSSALVAAVILSALFIIFEVLVYASLIAVMPRAGGDYVWQTRILGGPIGFVMAATGWWFILAHWVPIYANILAVEVIQPTLTILGYTGTSAFHADWWPYSATDGNGIFFTSILTAVFASVVIALGMRNYAKIQKYCFYGGMLGLVLMIGIFLFHSHQDFINAYNSSAHSLYGVKGDAYHQTVAAGSGFSTPGVGSFPVKETFLLLPFIVFYNLWPNWGATLYGEVRGASDFRKNIYAMGGALVFMTVITVITLAAMAHSVGLNFYGILSGEYWLTVTKEPFYMFPYPGTLAAFFYHSEIVQLIIIWLLGLWFIGWAGTLFLSSTRMVFAAAFDRMLPEWAAKVDERSHVPLGALALMFAPGIVVSALYAYNTTFYGYTLDATLVIAATFFATTLAAMILPFTKPEMYRASPIARYTVAGIPLITAAGAVFMGFLVFIFFKWFQDDVYYVNNHKSLIYMAVLYVLAIVVYIAARAARRREGIDLTKINSEIPVE
ncbi:MAG TPA: APC family permease [Gaiellales bacterium]|jgi:amino acid transporter|nr:APC family permease [Gaiellales bacterium]